MKYNFQGFHNFSASAWISMLNSWYCVNLDVHYSFLSSEQSSENHKRSLEHINCQRKLSSFLFWQRYYNTELHKSMSFHLLAHFQKKPSLLYINLNMNCSFLSIIISVKASEQAIVWAEIFKANFFIPVLTDIIQYVTL